MDMTDNFPDSELLINISPAGKLTYAGPQRGLALFVSRGTAVTPEAGHSFSTQTLT